MIINDKKQSVKKITKKKKRLLIGWREWIALPALDIPFIKAKIDTGARTSALHAFALRPFQEEGKQKICFDIHPFQHNTETIVTCIADVVDKRLITDSGGHTEERFVICTSMMIGEYCASIEISLTERENMLFRMLLGRSALSRQFRINPRRSFITTREKLK